MRTMNLLSIFVFLISLQIYENINPQFPNLTHLIIKRQHFIVQRGGFETLGNLLIPIIGITIADIMMYDITRIRQMSVRFYQIFFHLQ
jgi:hypothetical protein